MANPAANLTSAASFEDILRLVRQPSTSDRDRVRLVMLYALRFEVDAPRVRQLQDYLVTAGVRDRHVELGWRHTGDGKAPLVLYRS